MTGTAPTVVWDGLCYLLGQEPDIEIAAEAGDGRQTVDVAAAVTRSATTDTSAPSLIGASILLAPFFSPARKVRSADPLDLGAQSDLIRIPHLVTVMEPSAAARRTERHRRIWRAPAPHADQSLCTAAEVEIPSFTATENGYMSADSPVFRMLRDLRAAAEGDTVDMNRERADTYLRVLAEAELRRVTSRPWGGAQRAGYAARVKRVAQVLAFVGAVDDGVADQVLDDFELALGARSAGQAGSVPGSFMQRAAERTRLAKRVSVPPTAAGRSAAARSGTGMAAGRMQAPVPLGQIVRVRGADVHGEVCLLSYAAPRPAARPAVAGPGHHHRWRDRRAHRPARCGRQDPAASRRSDGQPDSTQPRRAPAEHDRGPAAGGRAAPPARPLAVRDRATAQGAARHHRRTR